MIKRITFIIILGLGFLTTFAQNRLHYSANAGSSFYSIPGVSWTSTDIDSNKVEVVPIGFQFKYRNNYYTHIAVSPKGWVSFDTTVTNVDTNSKLSTSIAKNLLAPMWDDHLIMPGRFGTDGKYSVNNGADTIFFFKWERYLQGDCVASCNNFFLGLVKGSNKILFIYEVLHHGVQPSGLSAYIGIVGDTASTGNDFLSINHTASSGAKNVWSNLESSTNKVPQNYQAGFYYEIIPCDSVKFGSISDTIRCKPFVAPSKKKFFTSGTYKDTIRTANGCDSIITINLHKLPTLVYRDTVVDTNCYKYQLPSGKKLYSTSQHIDTLVAPDGCDSIVLYDITISQPKIDTIKMVACERIISPSRKYLWTQSGVYTDTVITPGLNTCDSFLVVYLTVYQPSLKRDTVVSCDSFIWSRNQVRYASSGVHYDSLLSKGGCDSVAVLNLTINNSYSHTKNVTSCGTYKSPSGKYAWNNSGTFYDTLATQFGCDSSFEIHLIINHSTIDTTQVSTCDFYDWNVSSNRYFKSGVYFDTLKRKNSCDSIKVLDLQIFKSSDSSYSAVACDKYVSPSKKYTWSKSGQYSDTVKNIVGCDSVIHVSLQVYTSYSDTLKIEECDSFYWNQNGKKYFESGIYYDSYSTSKGCDSTIVLDLTLHKSSFSTTKIVACDSFLSPSKKYVWKTSGLYLDTISGVSGCFSVVEIDLEILNFKSKISIANDSLKSLGDLGNYQWLMCNSEGYQTINGATKNYFLPKSNGKYALETTSGNCTDTSTCLLFNTSSVFKKSLNEGLSIYPNPAENVTQILSTEQIESIALIDLSGSVIYVPNSNGNESRLDLSQVKSGVYFVQVNFGNDSIKVLRLFVVK